MLRQWTPEARRVRDFTWPAVSLLSGSMLNGILEGASKERRIEDLWLPYFSVSTNLTCATPHIHREGPLFDAMRALRLEIAQEQGVPPFVIFHDSTLREMAAQRPESLERMRLISGVGDTKLQRYGNPFLKVIQAHSLPSPLENGLSSQQF